MRIHRILKRIVGHPKVQLVVGCLLLIYSLIAIFSDYLNLNHSVLGVVMWHVWNAVPSLLQAFERIEKGEQ